MFFYFRKEKLDEKLPATKSKMLVETGDILIFCVLDHIIIAEKYLSFIEQGLVLFCP